MAAEGCQGSFPGAENCLGKGQVRPLPVCAEVINPAPPSAGPSRSNAFRCENPFALGGGRLRIPLLSNKHPSPDSRIKNTANTEG